MAENLIKAPEFAIIRKRMLNQEQIDRLLSIKSDEVNKVLLVELFSNKATKREDGTYSVEEPYMYPSQEFILPANTLPNNKETILTTAGLYIFNLHMISAAFGSIIPYINKTIDSKVKDELYDKLSTLIIEKKLQVKQFKVFQDRLSRLASSCGFLMDGLSKECLIPFPAVEKAKKELFEKYKDEIDKNNSSLYIEKIEKTLLEIARNELKQYTGYTMFQKGGKPDFGNNYKNNMVTVGPMPDLINGGRVICKNSYDEGLDLASFATHCNKAIYASYMRGVKTAEGGTMTKYLYALMHNVVAGPDGSDCKSDMYKEVLITKENKKNYIYRYIYEGKKNSNGDRIYTELTKENIDNYIGKTVKMRTPLFCRSSSNAICNVCLGNLYKNLGIKNIGLTTTRASSSIMYVEMKAMHNMSLKLKEINVFDYITKIPK